MKSLYAYSENDKGAIVSLGFKRLIDRLQMPFTKYSLLNSPY